MLKKKREYGGMTRTVKSVCITSMEQSPSSEANSQSAGREIPRSLCNPQFHNHLHNSPLLVPIPNHTYPVYNFPPYFPNIHSNCNFPFMPMSNEWSLSFGFSHQSFLSTSYLSYACFMTHPPNLPRFYGPNNIW
jgi:hypothetical protein